MNTGLSSREQKEFIKNLAMLILLLLIKIFQILFFLLSVNFQWKNNAKEGGVTSDKKTVFALYSDMFEGQGPYPEGRSLVQGSQASLQRSDCY